MVAIERKKSVSETKKGKGANMIHEFDFSTIANLDDGRIAASWNLLLSRITHDCHDRPAIGDSRKMALEMEMSPVMDEAGNVEVINVKFQVKHSMPAVKSQKKYELQPRGKYKLVFNDLCDDPNQMTLDENNEAWEDE